MYLKKLDWDAYTRCARQAAADGIVLLRNENNVLPLREGERVSLFGRGQLTYYKSGTGSGGMVNVSHVTGIREALDSEPGIRLNRELMEMYDRWNEENPPLTGAGWGEDPWSQEEMPLTEDIVKRAAQESDTAICIIARTAGEDRDNGEEAGSFLLTDTEMRMLRLVRAEYDRMVVLLNTGSVIDMSFVETAGPDAVMYVWQGGMVGGLGVADVLCGRVSPGGHLTDTIARSCSDYPSSPNFGRGSEEIYQEDIYVGYRYFETAARDRVLYPFGFGLTYTSFSIECRKESEAECGVRNSGSISLDVTVTNTGKVSGRQVVQVYARLPQGRLGKPLRTLVGFMKTRLLASGESQTLAFSIPVRNLASYDDSGIVAGRGCWVLERGRYDLFAGDNVRDAECVTSDGAFTLSDDWILEETHEACAPVKRFQRMVMRQDKTGTRDRSGGDAVLHPEYEDVPLRSADNRERIRENMPSELPPASGSNVLMDVRDGTCRLEDFISQLDDEQLYCIVRGEGMGSPLATPGTAAAFGGVSARLRERGVPVMCCDDGPSGMRLDCGDHAFSLPNGTLLACTFDPELNTELFSFLGLEMVKNRVDCLLGPGINIHRHPLNGRNFEYFSEDPYVTGVIASAQLKGLHTQNVTGVLKHFAANNRETMRRSLDSTVSQRALREIYLRGFEIAVREGGADAVMTSYGLLNGIHTSSLYDLTTTVLREEWGFDGIVMTDWWASFSSKELIDETLDGSGDIPGASGSGAAPDEETLTRDLMGGRITDFSTMVRAQNDLYMVVPDGESLGRPREDCARYEGEYLSPSSAKAAGISCDPRYRGTLADAVSEGRLSRAELQRCARNICNFALGSEAMNRLAGEGTRVEVINAPEDENLDAVAEVEFIPVPEEGLRLDLTGLGCAKDDDSLIGLELEAGAYYIMTLEGSCTASGLAQVPVTLFFTQIPIAVFVWSGTGGNTAVKRAGFVATTRSNVFRLHFGQAGVKLKSLTVRKDTSTDTHRIGLLPD